MLLKFARLRPTKKYEEWEKSVANGLIDQTQGNMYIQRAEVWFRIYFPKKGRAGGDLDNKMTSIFDALVKARVIMDDSYNCVERFHAEGIYRKGKGGAEIIIEDLED